MPLRELRQFPVIATGQIMPHLAQRIADDVEVVQKPLRIGSNRFAILGGLDDAPVGTDKSAAVVHETAEQRMPGRQSFLDRRCRRQFPGQGLQVVEPIEFGANRATGGVVGKEALVGADRGLGNGQGFCHRRAHRLCRFSLIANRLRARP